MTTDGGKRSGSWHDEEDKAWMEQAMIRAARAAEAGEVPVGAVLVAGADLIAGAGNGPISTSDPTAHAEILTIRAAARTFANYRLPGTTLYVTLEPCVMCMGAIVHSRIERLVFGAYDPKGGAACSTYRIGSDDLLNHTLTVHGGVLEDRCALLLKDFFATRRKNGPDPAR